MYASADGNQREKEYLENYCQQRETEFEITTLDTSTLSTTHINSGNSRMQFIQEWKDELHIIIKDARISYRIKEVLEENENTLKLLVYEWVWIDYLCELGMENEENITETMGFGTDHILTFAKNGEELKLLSDSCQEITGYENGTVEDIAYLESYVYENTGGTEKMSITPESMTAGIVSSNYSPGLAIAYSERWCGQNVAGTSSSQDSADYNPEYYYCSADCCNFVSQCLLAGGMAQSGEWWVIKNETDEVVEDSSYEKSGGAWRYVPYFEEHWTDLGHVKTRITSATQAEPGNVIYYLEEDGYSSNHIMLIVGINSNGQVLINGHNKDAYRYPLTLSNRIYYTIEFTHCYNNIISYNSTKHSVSCVLCGSKITEEHTFAIVASGISTCVICGYSE